MMLKTPIITMITAAKTIQPTQPVTSRCVIVALPPGRRRKDYLPTATAPVWHRAGTQGCWVMVGRCLAAARSSSSGSTTLS